MLNSATVMGRNTTILTVLSLSRLQSIAETLPGLRARVFGRMSWMAFVFGLCLLSANFGRLLVVYCRIAQI
jgi:hypothetical protein